jgi:ubiquinone/menaquinone biosynthesis C-methylase UbiE
VTREADKDVGRFDRWAPEYDRDPLQRHFFGPVHAQTLALVAGLGVQPRRVLDIGCGTGTLLRLLSRQFPGAALAGVDAAAGMIRAARQARVPAALAQATAGALPFADASFGLVISTVSFHHWADQRAGLAEVGRVLVPGGFFVLVDLHAVGYLRVFYALARRRDRMHTRREITQMLAAAHLHVQNWAPVFDLDPLLPLRNRPPRPPRSPTGRIPLVTAVIARSVPGPASGPQHRPGR